MWTLDYVQDNPFGGGFEAYRQNELRVDRQETETAGSQTEIKTETYTDAGRAYHSSYFEMLGEQGYPGLLLWLTLLGTGLVQMEILRRRYLQSNRRDEWIAPLATALQHGQIIYMVGSLFVGIAFQPFIYMMLAMQIGLVGYIKRRESMEQFKPMVVRDDMSAAKPAAQML
jgi:O-antigen ligase